MPAWLITILVRYVLPEIAEFFLAFIKNLKAARADDPTLLDTVEFIVTGIDRDHPDWSGDQKRSFAFGAIKQRAGRLGKDIGDSLINTMLELAVQKQKAVDLPPNSARTLGSQGGN